jgi:sortase A
LAENNTIKRTLGWLEAVLFIGGLALLAVYFQVRGSTEDQRAGGIEAFQQATQFQQEHTGDNPFATIQAPDQQLWSDQRKADYEASLKAASDLPLAVLSIDKLDIQVPVYNGADEINLNRGVARIKGTGRVGKQGNLGIAGHRDGFFRALKDISLNDTIELQTQNGLENFRVSSIDIVDPDDVSVLAPTSNSIITLVTCYPFYYVGHAPKRFIVRAVAEHLVVLN